MTLPTQSSQGKPPAQAVAAADLDLHFGFVSHAHVLQVELINNEPPEYSSICRQKKSTQDIVTDIARQTPCCIGCCGWQPTECITCTTTRCSYHRNASCARPVSPLLSNARLSPCLLSQEPCAIAGQRTLPSAPLWQLVSS